VAEFVVRRGPWKRESAEVPRSKSADASKRDYQPHRCDHSNITGEAVALVYDLAVAGKAKLECNLR
jgi:hypothetical protein